MAPERAALIAPDVTFERDYADCSREALLGIELALGRSRGTVPARKRAPKFSSAGDALPGIVTFNANGVQEAAALEIVGGKVAAMYVVRNPEKLRRITLP